MFKKPSDQRGFGVIIAIVVVIVAVIAIIVFVINDKDDTTPVVETPTSQTTTNPESTTNPEQPTTDPTPTPGPEQPQPPETTPTPEDGQLPSDWGELTTEEKIARNPLGCDLATQTIWASDGSCHDEESPTAPTGAPFEYIGIHGGSSYGVDSDLLVWAKQLECSHRRSGPEKDNNTCRISLEFRPTVALDVETDPAPPFMSKVRNITTYGLENVCWAIDASFVTLTTGQGNQAKVYAGSTRGYSSNSYREPIISSKDDCQTTDPDFELQGTGNWPWTWDFTFDDVLDSDLTKGVTLNINGTPKVDIAVDYYQFVPPHLEYVQAPVRYIDGSLEAICDGGDGSLCRIGFEVDLLTDINISLARYNEHTLPDFIHIDPFADRENSDKCLGLSAGFMNTESFVKLVNNRGSLDTLSFACHDNELPDTVRAGRYRVETETRGWRGSVSLINGGSIHLKTTPGVTIDDIKIYYNSAGRP